MSDNIRIYKDSPTAGGTNGTLVSTGTGASPIESGYILAPGSDYTEGEWIKLALRCQSGYKTVEASSRHARVTIEDSTHVTKWQLAPDNAGTPGTPMSWGASLDFASEIGATNTIFWARARVQTGEGAANDTSVDIEVNAALAAA
jgi:hypothetical protein